MHVYFVRHGETDFNTHFIHQAPNSPLNENGYDQARTVGEFLRPTNPTRVVSSTFERAIQTARIIGQSVGVLPVRSPLFCEVGWPTSLIGKHLYGPQGLWFLFLSVFKRNSLTWRYEDAENFSDIYNRVQKSFRYIESLTEEHESIVIVSHSEYIRLMVRFMCHGEQLTVSELVKTLFGVNSLKNGEVVHVEYVGPTIQGTCPWLRR
jgi:probable phosphoglycerate mutase